MLTLWAYVLYSYILGLNITYIFNNISYIVPLLLSGLSLICLYRFLIRLLLPPFTPIFIHFIFDILHILRIFHVL
jgi:hypothetical protein